MAGGEMNGLLRQLRGLAMAGPENGLSDGELLARYLADRDEAAFAALVHRHGGLVWGVCRRLLSRVPDAEDAFQATFLILARKAASIRKYNSLGSWLHGVACRVSRKLRADLARRDQFPPSAPAPPEDPAEGVSWREVRTVLDEELDRLPEKYRAPLVLCYLEELTQDEAARRLGWEPGVFRGRLDRGRQRLRGRLTRRGLGLSAALLGASLSPSLTTAAPAALAVAAVKAVTGSPSPLILALTEGVIRAMFLNKIKALMAVLIVLCLGGLSAGLLSGSLAAQAPAGPGDTVLEPGASPAPGGIRLPGTTTADPTSRPPASDLERRVAELEKQVQRLTKELDAVRSGQQGKLSEAGGAAQTVVLRLRNVTAADAGRVIKEMMGDARVSIGVEESTNSLIVRASPTDLKTIEAVIAKVDLPEAPAKPKSPTTPQFKILSVKNTDPESVVAVLTKIFNDKKQLRISAVNENTGILIYGTPEEIAEVQAVITALEGAAKPAAPKKGSGSPEGPIGR